MLNAILLTYIKLPFVFKTFVLSILSGCCRQVLLNLYLFLFVLQMVFLPEACDYIGESKQQSMEMAESIQGEVITEYKKLAKDLNVWLSIGGFHEKVI